MLDKEPQYSIPTCVGQPSTSCKFEIPSPPAEPAAQTQFEFIPWGKLAKEPGGALCGCLLTKNIMILASWAILLVDAAWRRRGRCSCTKRSPS